tara:strand:+ start:521 stop:1609 length:1089 start_codon:yes stop_codon:yes gene_type:complete
MMQKNKLPLKGLKILDLTRLLPGPVATMHLADMGAKVIKIEDKNQGDYSRSMSHVRNQISLLYLTVNKNKKVLRLNLKEKKDYKKFLHLIKEVDVLIESFRPGVMKKLHLDWNVLKNHNEKLVMCSISGFGQNGPLSSLAGHDINYLGLSGMLSQNSGSDGKPVLPNLQIADLLGGALSAVQGILAGVFSVKMGNKGCFVDISMTDSVFAHNIMPLLSINFFGKSSNPARDFLTGGLPCYNIYKTRDKKFMALGALELKFWRNFCLILNRKDLIKKHWTLGQKIGGTQAMKVKAELEEVFSTKSREYWTNEFLEKDCCVTPILTAEEAISHYHFVEGKKIFTENHKTEGKYWKVKTPFVFKN